MAENVRVRFAPSPTGVLHVGGARTALYNWLFARQRGGVFVLRVEDTDLARSTEEFAANILEGMRWLGLDWDEGPDVGGPFGPYRQRERAATYGEAASRLLAAGTAYRCFCTAERLDALRAEQEAGKLPPRYDRRCRDLPAGEPERRAASGEPFVVRLRVPEEGVARWDDLVKGPIEFQHREIADEVLVRSDGSPLYNFCAVCDDAAMRITHIIRGEDHISNTPKQIILARALGVEPPIYGHLPLLLGADKSKLSKRHGATSLTWFRDQGYPAEALFNFLALLGWAPPEGKGEVLSRAEVLSLWKVEQVSKSGAVFDYDKLGWLAGEYVRRIPRSEFARLAAPHLVAKGYLPAGDLDAKGGLVEAICALEQERVRVVAEIAERTAFYFRDPEGYDAQAAKNLTKRPDAAILLDAYAARLEAEPFDVPARLEERSRAFATERGVKFGELVHPVRAALTGSAASPGLFDVMAILGREAVCRRLRAAAARLRSGALAAPR